MHTNRTQSSAIQLFCTIKAYLCCFTQFTVDQSKLTVNGSVLSDTPNVRYLVALYSRLKQDYINFILQTTFGLLLNLHLKFGAILSKTYEDMTLYPHVYQNVHCTLLQKTSVYSNGLYIRVCNSRNIESVSLC